MFTAWTILSPNFPSQHQRVPHGSILFKNVLSHRVQNTGIWLSLQVFMSHHAPCSNLLMLLTCLSPSPSCSFPPLFLSLLTFPLVYSWHPLPFLSSPLSGECETESAVLLSQYFSFTWKPVIGCLRDEITSVVALTPNSSSPLFTVSLSLRFWGLCLWDWKCSCYTSLFLYDSSESSLSAARISRFPPQLALSKKNTLDEFQPKVWQLFHFKQRLWKEATRSEWCNLHYKKTTHLLI